jgi:16S rRNA (adenine1518-N6/adenine1519-N6)-dimethyltransferase
MKTRRKTPKLGQHFLRGAWAARALVRAVGIRRGEPVVEIGPGTGALTAELLASGARVIAVEKDRVLSETLEKRFIDEVTSGSLRIVTNDIRDTELGTLGLKNGCYAVAANIPYYITGEILRMFLSANVQPHTIALLVQKEVAERIVSKRESILSLSVKAYGEPRIVAKVSRGNFSPPPSVDSAILAITDISRDFFRNTDEEFFFRLLHAGFASKRKFLSGNLARIAPKPAVLEAFGHCGIPQNARAEEIPLEKWKCLAQAFAR